MAIMHLLRHRVIPVVLAVIMTACVHTQPSPSPSADPLEERLTSLSEKEGEFSDLSFSPGTVTASTVNAGKLNHWDLSDGIIHTAEGDDSGRHRPFSTIDIPEMVRRARALTRSCQEERYIIRVDVLTRSAMRTTLRCGTDDLSAILHPATRILLNGHELKQLKPDHSEAYWQQVLDEIRIINPTMRLSVLESYPNTFTALLSKDNNGCRSSVRRELNASRLELTDSCQFDTAQAMQLGKVTGTRLAAAISQVARKNRFTVDETAWVKLWSEYEYSIRIYVAGAKGAGQTVITDS